MTAQVGAGVPVHGHHHRFSSVPHLLLPHLEEDVCLGCHLWYDNRQLGRNCSTITSEPALRLTALGQLDVHFSQSVEAGYAGCACNNVCTHMCKTLRCAGAAAGQVAAIICWLVVCQTEMGEINVDNLGADYPMLAGNVAALGVSCIVTTIMSFVAGEDFDWDIMRNGIKMIEYDGTDKLADEGQDSFEALERALKYVSLPCLFAVLWLIVHASD